MRKIRNLLKMNGFDRLLLNNHEEEIALVSICETANEEDN